ncbi:MAG TPA: phospholipase D-like domain-containing protein [Acetobacteraceae bacterium]|jgi:cardiolipin synthase
MPPPALPNAKLHRRRLLALAAAAPLAACAGAPSLRDYLGGDDGSLQRSILGSRNPLTHTERSALLTTLPPAESTDALQRQFVLQQALSESPLAFGNKATLLRDGSGAFPAMFQAMQQARDHINMEYFIFQDAAWQGLKLSDVLIERMQHGVAVNIVYDSFGSNTTPASLFDRLRRAGARVVEFDPLNPLQAHTGWDPNHRDHRKILVVDGRIGFTGGINFDPVYENPPSAGIPANGDMGHAYWRDTAIRIEGPAVAELQKLFFATWKQQKGPPAAPARYFPPLPRVGVQTIRIIGSAPDDQRPLLYISLMTAVLSAMKNVWFSTGYFVPPHGEREDLGRTARAKVDVRLVLPSHADVPATVYAARAAYGDLLEDGAHIYEMQNAVLHSKLATIDGVWSVVGSSNLDRRSVVFNNEVDAVILGHETASQVEALLRQDMSESHEITLAKWRARSLEERLHEMEARVWQYWM